MSTPPSSPHPFLAILAKYKPPVWKQIQALLKLSPKSTYVLSSTRHFSTEINFHHRLLKDYPQRQGKYFRPTLLLLTAQALGVPLKKAINTAAAMQLSEDWLLIKDDFEDDSLMRRGAPALHRLYGPELAVNASDALHLLMWKILQNNHLILSQKTTLAVMNEFYHMLMRTALGQTIEIHVTKQNRLDLTNKDIFFIIDGKTSYYSVAGPMRLAAIIAGAKTQWTNSIFTFGHALGRCFQITDDLLDLTTDFAGLKKQTGNDVYEGKRTIMLVHLLRHASPRHLKFLKTVLAKPREKKTAKEVKQVIALMQAYGSLEYGRKLAKDYANQAEITFNKLMKPLPQSPAKRRLHLAIDFVLNRTF